MNATLPLFRARGHGRIRLPRPVWYVSSTILVGVVVSLFLAGCGAAASSGLPSLGSSSPKAKASSSANLGAAIESCLRRHGAKLPAGFNPYNSAAYPQLHKPNADVVTRAVNACNSLIEETEPPLTTAAKRKILDFVACLRSYGLAVPDPTFYQGERVWGLELGPAVSPNSAKFESAEAACSKRTPGVLGPLS